MRIEIVKIRDDVLQNYSSAPFFQKVHGPTRLKHRTD